MIYIVNEKTKEHRILKNGRDCDVGNVYPGSHSNDNWRVVKADADGWIEWSGGECPLPENEDCEYLVHINHGNRDLASTTKACYLKWSIRGHSDSVIAYRPVLEPQAEQVKEWRGPEDGLPPVGTVCQVYIANRDAWTETEVKAHVDGLALFKNGTGGHFYGRTAEHYRPIRTDRERWIASAEYAIEDSTGEPANSTHLGILFDAGLARLPEE